MNKRASIFHWIIFGVLAAFGIFFILSFDIQITQPKGVWQLSYIHAYEEAEKSLLVQDNAINNIAESARQDTMKKAFDADIGCGKMDNFVLWNNKGNLCNPPLEQKFPEKLKQELLTQLNLNYQITLKEGYAHGETAERKLITSIPDIAAKNKLATLFDGRLFLTDPFYLRYEYNPGFRAKVSFAEFYELQSTVQKLILDCRKVEELKACLDTRKPAFFSYSNCAQPSFDEKERKVPFCVNYLGNQFLFGLDFST